jgi:CRP-like cAMP-binding protein
MCGNPRSHDLGSGRLEALLEAVYHEARSALVTAQNHLIELLPRTARGRLLAICEPVNLVMSDILSEAGQPTRYVYFPVDAFISLVTLIDKRPALEVGMVGREGMVGVELVLGVATTPLHTVVQGAGTAWRIGARAFTAELAKSPALRQALNRYLYVLMGQLASAAGCLRFHLLGPRLARWLLMTQDRAHSDSFHVTHEFLAYMLGVRRVGITTAAKSLQRRGLIEYRRGELRVLDRRALEAAACDCYGIEQRAYAHAMG